MKNAPFPTEIVYQRGGTASPAVYSVDPRDPEATEDARQAAIRRRRNLKVSRQKKRRAFEKRAALATVALASPDPAKP